MITRLKSSVKVGGHSGLWKRCGGQSSGLRSLRARFGFIALTQDLRPGLSHAALPGLRLGLILFALRVVISQVKIPALVRIERDSGWGHLDYCSASNYGGGTTFVGRRFLSGTTGSGCLCFGLWGGAWDRTGRRCCRRRRAGRGRCSTPCWWEPSRRFWLRRR
jgi:hypothetical protein